MASGSIRELSKSIQAFFAVTTASGPGSSSQPTYKSKELPQQLVQIIQSYVQKHSNIDESDADRLHDDLIGIYQKHVALEKSKLAAFLYCLNLLRPLIQGYNKLKSWWETVIVRIIDGTGYKTVEIQHATEFLLSVLDHSDEDSAGAAATAKISNFFANALLDAYLKRTKTPGPETEQLTLDDAMIAKQIEAVLVTYGRRKPKDFLIAVDRLVVEMEHRMQALGLLSTFVRHQPPHLYVVVESSLIEHLLQCLMIDTSTTVISLALACLIMFLPHIPIAVKAHLPRLFLIYSRILCWDRLNSPSADDAPQTDSQDDTFGLTEQCPSPVDEQDWAKLSSSFDTAESTAPELLHYFTFLYGLYPLNLISYIRKPRRYLKDINFPRAEEFDFDQALIRTRTEQFRRVHALHPNFYNTTPEDELTDNRWLKSDPVDVVSECMGLCLAAPEILDTQPYSSRSYPLNGIPSHLLHENDIPRQSLLDKDDDSAILKRSVENIKTDALTGSAVGFTQATLRARNRTLDSPSTQSLATGSPSVRAFDEPPTSPTLNNQHSSPHVLRDVPMPENESTTSFLSSSNLSPRLGPVSRSQMPRSPAMRPAPQIEANMAFLQREVMLLRSDLNFERYLKQQHLAHIGQLQRKQVKEATLEAETQNLINTTRALKGQLAKANDAYSSLKKETATGRNQAKKLEAELTTRVRSLREDEKQWRAEEESLRVELHKAKTGCDHLRQLVVDSESKELLARQELSFAKIKLERLDELQSRIAELEELIRSCESKELMYASAVEERDAIRLELAAAKLMIRSL